MPVPDRSGAAGSIESYMLALEAALSVLPVKERRDILLETRSHVAERLERDPSLQIGEVLADLGEPEAYARGFLPKREVEGTALTGLASLSASGWKSLPVFVVVFAGYGIAFICVLLAIAKIAEPDATGWYVRTVGEHRSTGLMISDPNHGGRDVLGYWLVVITLSIAFSTHWLLSRLLRRFSSRSTLIR